MDSSREHMEFGWHLFSSTFVGGTFVGDQIPWEGLASDYRQFGVRDLPIAQEAAVPQVRKQEGPLLRAAPWRFTALDGRRAPMAKLSCYFAAGT